MRIALATTSLGKFGGVASFQNHLAAQLRALGHDVVQYKIGREDCDAGRIICIEQDVIKRPDLRFEAAEGSYCFWPALWGRHDVVHITNPGELHNEFDEEQLLNPAGPLVLTIHDPHELDVLGPTLIRLCEAAHVVTFVGWRYMCSFLEGGYVENMAGKATYLMHPYVRRAHPEYPWLKRRLAICTSAWRPAKRIELIVRAAEFLPFDEPEGIEPLQFWSGEGVDYVEDRCLGLAGWEHCEDRGPWEDEAMPAIYGPARVVVNMSYFDPTDTGRTEYPILEAWDYQVIPVVGSDFAGEGMGPGMRDILVDGLNCVVVEPAPDAIANGIMRAMDLGRRQSILRDYLSHHEVVGDEYVIAYEDARQAWAYSHK